MISIHPLTHLDAVDLTRLITGYVSHAHYQVTASESAGHFGLSLDLVRLSQPYHKRYDPTDDESLARYAELPALGFCFGAYEGETCVGMALAEPMHWNRSLWVWELHVDPAHQRRGIGRRLVDALTERARAAHLRTVVCETQTTNVPAIDFYRSVGFRLEGVDISYYSNEDFPDGEIALFMKKRIPRGKW